MTLEEQLREWGEQEERRLNPRPAARIDSRWILTGLAENEMGKRVCLTEAEAFEIGRMIKHYRVVKKDEVYILTAYYEDTQP